MFFAGCPRVASRMPWPLSYEWTPSPEKLEGYARSDYGIKSTFEKFKFHINFSLDDSVGGTCVYNDFLWHNQYLYPNLEIIT